LGGESGAAKLKKITPCSKRRMKREKKNTGRRNSGESYLK